MILWALLAIVLIAIAVTEAATMIDNADEGNQ